MAGGKIRDRSLFTSSERVEGGGQDWHLLMSMVAANPQMLCVYMSGDKSLKRCMPSGGEAKLVAREAGADAPQRKEGSEPATVHALSLWRPLPPSMCMIT